MSSSAQSNLQGSTSEKAPSGKLRAFATSPFQRFHRRRSSDPPPSIHSTTGVDSKSLEESGPVVARSGSEEPQPSSSSSPDVGEEQVTKEARGMPQSPVRRILVRNPDGSLVMRPAASVKKSGSGSRNSARGVGEEPDRNPLQRPKPYNRGVGDKKTANKSTESALGALGSLFKGFVHTRLE
ncbi:hypothetical protein FRC01_003279 [Tulasnella sp. 417]|nr:hypothetical protein FRC01_003279 [Tulasnella sp. 417]